MASILCTLNLCLGIWLGIRFTQRAGKPAPAIGPSPIPPNHWHVRGTQALEHQIEAIIDLAQQPQAVPMDILVQALARLLEITRTIRGQLTQLASGVDAYEPERSLATTDRSVDTDAGDMQFDFEREQRTDPAHQEHQARRRPYQAIQWAAPVSGRDLPEPQEFERVQCLELSTSEVTFVANKWPNAPQVVITLGQPSDLKFILAEVVQQSMKFIGDTWQESVRCRFIKRIDSDIYRWNDDQVCLEMWAQPQRCFAGAYSATDDAPAF